MVCPGSHVVGNTSRSVTARNGKARRGSQGRDRKGGAGLGGARHGLDSKIYPLIFFARKTFQ